MRGKRERWREKNERKGGREREIYRGREGGRNELDSWGGRP